MKKTLTNISCVKVCLWFCFVIIQSNSQIQASYGDNTAPPSLVKDTSDFLKNLMLSNPGFFKTYIDSSEEFEIQVIYTQINRDEVNKPAFRLYSYNLDDEKYFCPASTSKLPVMLLALEKINQFKKKGIDKYTAMRFDSAWPCQKTAVFDTVAPDSILSVAHYIQKILLVSDNDAYNRLYEFVGPDKINKRLWQMGFKKAYIVQQFNSCDAAQNRYTNPFSFIDKEGNTLFYQPLKKSRKNIKNPFGTVLKGTAYTTDDGEFINEPRDLTYYNTLTLIDLHNIFLRVIFPDAFKERDQFQLNENDYPFLYKYLCMLPRESEFVKYHDSIRYPDNRKKYLMYGTDTCKTIKNDSLRIFNIVGRLSGYLTDCAYIVDFNNNVEFIVTATIYNNQSGIFDVANYRYKKLGLPFLQELGQLLYKYELNRTKAVEPNLNYLKNCIKN